MKKNILLIGGTKGIGLEIVKELSPDHNIIVASRSDENLSDYNVTYHKFDALTDDISVIRFTRHPRWLCILSW